MKQKNFYLFSLIIFFVLPLLGCGKKPVIVATPIVEETFAAKIVNPDIFETANSLVLTPLTPGPGVIASDDIDRLSSYFSQALINNSQSVKIVFDEREDNVRMQLRGRITEKSQDGMMKMWGKQRVLEVELKIYDPQTRQLVLFYTDREEDELKTDYKIMAAALGRRFAEYLNEVK